MEQGMKVWCVAFRVVAKIAIKIAQSSLPLFSMWELPSLDTRSRDILRDVKLQGPVPLTARMCLTSPLQSRMQCKIPTTLSGDNDNTVTTEKEPSTVCQRSKPRIMLCFTIRAITSLHPSAQLLHICSKTLNDNPVGKASIKV